MSSKKSVRFKFCIYALTLYLSTFSHVDCFYTQRQRYASRMLKITPKECHSPDFPSVTGICMISLECQQRSGTVIGACRDGHLFGACCHDPIATPAPPDSSGPASSTESGSSSSTTAPTTQAATTTTTTSTTTPAPTTSGEGLSEAASSFIPEFSLRSSSSSPFMPETTLRIRDTSDMDSSSIPSLIDTFSELSPTFMSKLALDEHTTGIYSSSLPTASSDTQKESTPETGSSSSSAPLDDTRSLLDETPTNAPQEVPAQTTRDDAHVPETVMEVGGVGHETEFKDNMIKYIDELVTLKTEPPVVASEEKQGVNDIPFSTFTLVTSGKSNEDTGPTAWAWTPTSTSTEPPPPPSSSENDVSSSTEYTTTGGGSSTTFHSTSEASSSSTNDYRLDVSSSPSSSPYGYSVVPEALDRSTNGYGSYYHYLTNGGHRTTKDYSPDVSSSTTFGYPVSSDGSSTSNYITTGGGTTNDYITTGGSSTVPDYTSTGGSTTNDYITTGGSTTNYISTGGGPVNDYIPGNFNGYSHGYGSTGGSTTHDYITTGGSTTNDYISTGGSTTDDYITTGGSSSSKSDEILAVSVTQTVGSSSTEGNEIATSTTGSSTEATSPTKFTFSKLRYTPRPFKPRQTTEKVVWTRPPAAEAQWSSKPLNVPEEEEEEDDTDDDQTPMSSTVASSTERLPETTMASSTESSSSPVEEETQSESWLSSSTNEPPPFTMSTGFEWPSSTMLSSIFGSSSTLSSLEKEVDPQSNISNSRSDLSGLTTNEVVVTSSSPSSTFSSKSVTALEKRTGSGGGDIANSTPAAAVLASTLRTLLDKAKSKHKTGVPSTKPTKPSKPKTTPSTTTTTTTTTVAPTVAVKETVKRKGTKQPGPVKSRGKNKVKPVKKVTTVKTTNSTRKRLDYKRDCGVRPLIKRGRIVGGTPSRFGSWPWHALVKETVWWGIFSKIKCGGVLIGAQHVLTAAHCQPQQTGTLSVVLGITDSDDKDSRAITKGVRRVIPHPQFNPRTYENDIAILELDSPVDFLPHIVPICLPRDDDELEGKTAYVTGMGLLKHDGERPLVLQEVDLPILNNTECQKMFVRSGNKKPIIESFICAGYEQGRKDSCGGDSGGPLSVKRPNGQWVLAGTVSHGIKCAQPDQPGVYMRTSYYKPWVDRVLNAARSRYRGIPRCNAPPLICARQRHRPPTARHETGFVSTLFRIFRLARKMVDERRSSSS